MPISRQLCLSLALIGLLTACAVTPEIDSQPAVAASAEADEAAKFNSATIDLAPESLFAIIGFDVKSPDMINESARDIFYGEALPMAARYGFSRHATFLVTEVSVGEFKPQGFLLSSWPSQTAFADFQGDPKWPGYDVLRPEIYNDIRYYRDVQEDGLTLTLRDDKYYTLAIAYFNPDNPGDYEQYLSSLEGVVAENGGKFLLKLKSPKLESLSGEPSPDQLTLVEWNDASGVDRVLSSDAYKANRHFSASGTTELAFYRLKLSL